MMSLFLSIVLRLVFGVGLLFAAANICCMVRVAYLHYVALDNRPNSCLPPLGSGLMCVSLYFGDYSHFLLPLLLDYPFPLFLIIPAVKIYRFFKG